MAGPGSGGGRRATRGGCDRTRARRRGRQGRGGGGGVGCACAKSQRRRPRSKAEGNRARLVRHLQARDARLTTQHEPQPTGGEVHEEREEA
jgi:hypothetical protein